MSDQDKLIYQCSKTKAGKALLEFMREECERRFRGSSEDIQIQAGKHNVYLDLLDAIERGKEATGKGE